MNKLLLVFLSGTLFLLLSVVGLLFYAFSSHGNERLKTYIQNELETTIGLPVEVEKFSLQAGKATIFVHIDKQLEAEIVTHYDVLSQSFKGIYQVRAQDFKYDDILLRQVDINGHFKGIAEDILLDGQGTALDAHLVYRLRILEQSPQEIVASMRGVSLSEVLELSGQPSLATGKIDVDINMPDIGQEFANGYGKITLNKASFNDAVVQKTYDLTLPPKSYVTANVDMKLKGHILTLLANSNSNLFDLKLHNTTVDFTDKNITASYDMDVNEMGILTQNKLAGKLKASGNVQMKGDTYKINGTTPSLGGILHFDIADVFNLHLENVNIEKLLYLTKQTSYVKGVVNGTVSIKKDMHEGKYDLNVNKGQFNAQNIEKDFGYQIPSVNHFTFFSKGKIADKILQADVSLKSSVSDIELKKVLYDIEKTKVTADYDVFLPNIGLLMPNNKAVKRGYISIKGDVDFDKSLKLKGKAKGLGEKLNFSYDGKVADIDAQNLFVEKLLSLRALPKYVKGKLSSKINITNVSKQEGTFSIQSDKLITQPKAMESLVGKKLQMAIALDSKGKVDNGIVYAETSINTSMGLLELKNTKFDIDNNILTSKYVLDIANLEKTYTLTEQKMYGSMLLSGEFTQSKSVKATGATHSLGGDISYTLLSDNMNVNVKKVPVENILKMMGHNALVQGEAHGTAQYHLKNKIGVVDIDIKSFKIKPSSTMDTVKMFIGKDPTRIIYDTTNLKAKINGDVTTYVLTAKGSRSSIDVTEGKIDKLKNQHTAKFKFVYEKYTVTGSILGTVDNPKLVVDPSSIMQSKTGEKVQKELDRALGGDMGKAVGGLLKGLKF